MPLGESINTFDAEHKDADIEAGAGKEKKIQAAADVRTELDGARVTEKDKTVADLRKLQGMIETHLDSYGKKLEEARKGTDAAKIQSLEAIRGSLLGLREDTDKRLQALGAATATRDTAVVTTVERATTDGVNWMNQNPVLRYAGLGLAAVGGVSMLSWINGKMPWSKKAEEKPEAADKDKSKDKKKEEEKPKDGDKEEDAKEESTGSTFGRILKWTAGLTVLVGGGGLAYATLSGPRSNPSKSLDSAAGASNGVKTGVNTFTLAAGTEIYLGAEKLAGERELAGGFKAKMEGGTLVITVPDGIAAGATLPEFKAKNGTTETALSFRVE